MADGLATKCFVTTNKLFADNCKVDPNNERTLLINDVFATAAPYSSDITIMLQNVVNPSDNKPNDGFDGFEMYTYGDADMKYIQDKKTNIMVPQLACDYPCAACVEGDRTDCTLCWNHDAQKLPLEFLMSIPGTKGECKAECDYDYTSNGSDPKKCIACDTSCDDCLDGGKTNDYK